MIRAVQWLVRVKFVSNLEPTCRNRVGKNAPTVDPLESGGKKCTCRQPAGVIGSGGSDHQRVAGGSVEVIDLRRRKNTVKKTQIRRRNADSGDSFLYSEDISLRSG